MQQVIIRVYEGDLLPDNAQVERILATEEVPTGAGTNTRRLLTLLVTDGRFWLSEAEKQTEPIRGLPKPPEDAERLRA